MDVRRVLRRSFLKSMGGSALLAACGPALRTVANGSVCPTPPRTGGIRAIAFDLLTIFDPRGVDRRVAALLGENASMATTWKTRLFEYCWIRAAAGQYADFEQLVHDSLVSTARTQGVAIADPVRVQLESAFTELEPWPDAAEVLRGMQAGGLRLAPLANFAPRMIDVLLGRAGLRNLFEFQISTDQARTYKPDPRAYALAEAKFGLPVQQIAFAVFGSWDAAGARWCGYPTFWVNRLGVSPEQLIAADASGPDLASLAAWVSTRNGEA